MGIAHNHCIGVLDIDHVAVFRIQTRTHHHTPVALILRRTAAGATCQAFTGFYGRLATVRAFEAPEKSSASALASSQLGFDEGTLINLDVLIALDALFTTRATLYKARYDTILNALKLKAQAAALTDQDLLAVNALLK